MTEQTTSTILKRDRRPGLLMAAGMAIIWAASIVLALQVENLLTARNTLAYRDPSFELLVIAFCFLLCVLGGLMIWYGRMLRDGRPAARYITFAAVGTVIMLAIIFCAGAQFVSATNYFAAQESDYIRPAPRPDSAVAAFPTPALTRPTPVFDPNAKALAGVLTGSLDHLKVGTVFVSLAADGNSVQYVQFALNPVECLVQREGSFERRAIHQNSKQYIAGPLPVQDGRFYGAQDGLVVQGLLATPDEIMGTASLRFSDPDSGETCDLGTFEFDIFASE